MSINAGVRRAARTARRKRGRATGFRLSLTVCSSKNSRAERLSKGAFVITPIIRWFALPIDEQARADFQAALQRAGQLQASIERPPVAANERLCVKCSLAPVCLPEEARLAETLATEEGGAANYTADFFNDNEEISESVKNPLEHQPLRLFPADDDRQILHVLTNGAKVGRKGDRLEIWSPETEEKERYPVQEIGQVVHSRFCADYDAGIAPVRRKKFRCALGRLRRALYGRVVERARFGAAANPAISGVDQSGFLSESGEKISRSESARAVEFSAAGEPRIGARNRRREIINLRISANCSRR